MKWWQNNKLLIHHLATLTVTLMIGAMLFGAGFVFGIDNERNSYVTRFNALVAAVDKPLQKGDQCDRSK